MDGPIEVLSTSYRAQVQQERNKIPYLIVSLSSMTKVTTDHASPILRDSSSF